MKAYIDKTAIVAEIEKRRDSFYSLSKSCEKGTPAKAGFYAQAQTLEGILSFLDNIEVKEVDLENSVKGRIDYPFIGYDFPNIYPNYKELKDYCDKNGIKDGDKVKIIIIKDGIL